MRLPWASSTTNVDISLFGSNVIEDGYIQHSDYNTQTLNFNFRVKVDDHQNLYFKAITNWLDTQVPTRLTQSQLIPIPDKRGANTDAATNAGCAALAQQRRLDRRTIMGGMYERQLNANTVLTIEADYDVKDINQTFTQISDNINPNYKTYADLRHDGRLFDMPLRSYVGFFVNNMEQEGNTFHNLRRFWHARNLVQNRRGTIGTSAAGFEKNWNFVPKWTLAAGLGFEQSIVSAQTITYGRGGVASRARARIERFTTGRRKCR